MTLGIMGSSKRKVNEGVEIGREISVLVVDDDLLLQRIHSLMLRKFGMEAQAVGNGKEAVELCQSGASFNLVLMDMEMPIMDGPKATRELRAMGVKNMIVGLTSRDGDSERKSFMEAGLNECYVKPLTAEKITSLLQQLNNNNNNNDSH